MGNGIPEPECGLLGLANVQFKGLEETLLLDSKRACVESVNIPLEDLGALLTLNL